MNLKILKIKDPKLRKVCRDVSLQELRTNKIQDLIEAMLDFVYGRSNKGEGRDRRRPMTVGLSAGEAGILKKICIVDLAIGRKRFNDIHALINPEIIWHSKSKGLHREGCVNLPEIWGVIPRYKEVKVKTYDRSGNELIIHSKGWASVLLQHEIDHLYGHLFIDHLSDPTKAHLVKDEETVEYRKKYKNWNKFVDVSRWVRKTQDIPYIAN